MPKKIKFILLAAMSLDGKIALNNKHFTDWTSQEDKDHLHQILDKCDLIIVGNNTYKTAIKPLAKRNCLVFTKKIDKIKQKDNNCLYCNPQKVKIKKLLTEKGYRQVAILGGTATYSFALEKDLIDEIYLTVEPCVFGSGLGLFETGLKKILKYKLISIKKLNKTGSVLLRYKK